MKTVILLLFISQTVEENRILNLMRESLPSALNYIESLKSRVEIYKNYLPLENKIRSILERSWKEMKEIPAANYPVGCNKEKFQWCGDGLDEERLVFLDRFFIDEYEVSVKDYEQCVELGGCSPLPLTSPRGAECNWKYRKKRANHPINCVDYKSAEKFCRWLGKYVPSEEEWEASARSYEGRKFTWGNTMVCDPACVSLSLYPPDITCRVKLLSNTCERGSKVNDVSAFGVYDLAGNLMEWTSSIKKDASGKEARELRILKGASFLSTGTADLYTYERTLVPSDAYSENIGFRCAGK